MSIFFVVLFAYAIPLGIIWKCGNDLQDSRMYVAAIIPVINLFLAATFIVWFVSTVLDIAVFKKKKGEDE